MFDALQATDLPSAISEVLQTSKGTTFYVLTVAGEHGIPPEKSPAREADKQEDGGTSAFLTEVSNLSGEQDRKPDYIRNIDIPESVLVDVKKM